MKKWLSYIVVAMVCGICFSSCSDENIVDPTQSSSPIMKLKIALPGSSRAVGDYVDQDPNLDNTTEGQRYIADNDIYVLEFRDKKLFHVVNDLIISGTNGDAERTLTGTLMNAEGSVQLVVLANLKEQGITIDFNNYIDKTEQEIYSELIYNYPTGNWDLSNRKLPMWGSTSEITLQATTNATCDMYRGVAKMGVKVDNACTGFTLKEIYVYYVNEQGYCAAPNKRPSSEMEIQFTEPEIPALSGQRGIGSPLKYVLSDDEVTAKAFLDKIYLSEVNNKTPGEGKKQLKVVVGGVYAGEGLVENNGSDLSYYRIDMEDDKDGAVAPFDIIRNHSYVFNITAVQNPGTPTPDDALDKAVVGLTVTVEDWVDEPMQGITPQYTLTVDNSVFGFEGLTIAKEILNITTDGTSWDLVKDKEGGDWFSVETLDPTTTSGKVQIKPDANISGEQRSGHFYIQAGKIRKKITVIQEPGETANCYLIRRPDTYLLKVDIKGNGRSEAWGDDTGSEKVDVSNGEGTALDVERLDIIWETVDGKPCKGLVTVSGTSIDPNGCIEYTVHDIDGAFRPGHGGNALIGGYNSAGTLVWSWHIWVVGDYSSGIQTEKWVNGYDMMDRNLGAYSNQPGTSSLGLLYQWGRKDPFIGVGKIDKTTRLLSEVKQAEVRWGTAGITSWGTLSEGSNLDAMHQNPTKILIDGCLSNTSGIKSKVGVDDTKLRQALWGTSSSSTDVKDNGVKTIYDPCPPGYRVPSVHTWIFSAKDGDTYNDNYNYNVTFVPKRNDYWGLNKNGTASFTSESNYYGFWIGYANAGSGSSGTNNTSQPKVNWFNNSSVDESKWGLLADNNTVAATWIPLSGVYDKKIDGFANISNYSSVHVNGILWLNAPAAANTNRPAGVFLHGTEGKYEFGTRWEEVPLENPYYEHVWYNGDYVLNKATKSNNGDYNRESDMWGNYYYVWAGKGQGDYNCTFRRKGNYETGDYKYVDTEKKQVEGYQDSGSNGSGRHIHALKENGSTLKAEPQYAGAVRCVRDKDAVKSSENVIDRQDITLRNGQPQEITITAVESWRVINPGKKWVVISPDNGNAGETRIKISSNNSSVKETATITIKFARGSEKTITVTQQ